MQPMRYKREGVRWFMSFVRGLVSDDRGAASVEYVIVTGLLAIALIGVAYGLAEAARLWFWRKVFRIVEY